MSSPWNQHHNGNPSLSAAHGRAGAPIHDRGTGHGAGTDEWDLLRSSPDYDREEMQGVSLPAAFSPSPAHWPAPAAPLVAAPEPAWVVPVPGCQPAGVWSPPAAPVERWPETADVAHLAGDLFAEAQGEGLWRAIDPTREEGVFAGASEGEEEVPAAWIGLLARDEGLDGDADGLDPSSSWAFLPDAMLQRGDGGRDLLNEAIQAGERAGLLDAGARTEPRLGAGEPVTTPGEPTPEGVPDLLDAALKAGVRAGLLDR